MSLSPIGVFGLETLLAATLFAAVWAICVRVRNYGFLDVTWTWSIGLLAALDAAFGPVAGGSRALVCAVGVAWSARLGSFIFVRVLRHHPHEDKRYASLRKQWRTPLAFLAFFELQALIAAVFSLPFLIVSFAQAPLGALQILGLSIAGVALVGEAVADQQAASFKKSNRDPRVLDRGLWRYSRHPNYFFEWMFWWGIAAAVITYPYGWLCLCCPVLIGYFLLRVTGIPLTEKHSLETHGEAYRDYQRRTSVLVPWAPRG